MSAPLPSLDGRSAGSIQVAEQPGLLAAIWNEIRPHRAAMHRALSVVRCDVRIADPGTGRVRIDGECACRDFVVDMITAGQRFVDERGHRLHNPAGAVRTHIRTRAAGDWIRRRRVDMGAQARTDRIRSSARARAAQ